MGAGRFNGRRITAAHSQRGVILLIALIMLVAMTLAAIGMMRSVDTGSLAAGNLAFKQATLNATNIGTNAGYTALISVANSNVAADKLILNVNNGQLCATATATAATAPTILPGTAPPDPAGGVAGCLNGAGTISLPGYSSTPINPCEVTGQTTGSINGTNCTTAWKLTPWWTVAANWNGAPSLTVTDPNNGGTMATVQYLTHRMCQLPNAMPNAVATGTSPNQQLCQTYNYVLPNPNGGLPFIQRLFFYRITARSVGTRNTVTYSQMLVLIGG